MADNVQAKSAEQRGQMAEQDPDSTKADVGCNAQPDTDRAEDDVAQRVSEESTVVAEDHQAPDGNEPDVAETDPATDRQDNGDGNKILSDEDQKADQPSQDSDQLTPGQDASSNVSQNLTSGSPDASAIASLSVQDAIVISQPDEDVTGDSPNPDPDSLSPHQDSDANLTDQDVISAGQRLASQGVSDPQNAETVLEDSKPDGTQPDHNETDDAKQYQPQEQDHIADESAQVTEEVSRVPQDRNEAPENPASDNDQATAKESTSANPAEVAPADTPDEVLTSQQPLVQEEPTGGSPEGTAENLNGISPANPPSLPAASSNSTPNNDAVQATNSNAMYRARQFPSESVRIPTAQGDAEEEPLPDGGSREDLRDLSMSKMRSSLPVDAYGDSKSTKSNRLPAIVQPDPRLARSLPASMDFPGLPADSRRGAPSGHIPRIPSASGSAKAETRGGDTRRALGSARLPPSVMKMSTVMVSARKRAVLNRSASVFYEEKQERKVISLDQAINSRPPMPFDLDGPGPWSYSPRNKPLNEDNAPEYTFGHKLNEKHGGGRTAYAKAWFNSSNDFTQKVHYEKRWPSPAHYSSTRSLLGRRKPTMADNPSFTIGVRSNFSISKRGSENEPAPNEYNPSKSNAAILKTAPSYTISRRHQGTKLWNGNELTPGPGTYNPRWGYSSSAVHRPSFTIQGVRRLKSHKLGPHATF